MAVLGYLAKLKRGLELAFGAHFLHDLSALCRLAHPESESSQYGTSS